MEKLLELFLQVPPWRLVAQPGVRVLEALCVPIKLHSQGEGRQEGREWGLLLSSLHLLPKRDVLSVDN